MRSSEELRRRALSQAARRRKQNQNGLCIDNCGRPVHIEFDGTERRRCKICLRRDAYWSAERREKLRKLYGRDYMRKIIRNQVRRSRRAS